MDRRKLELLESLNIGAQQHGEFRLYRRGKLPGLFGPRTRVNAEIASQAIADGLLEVARVETIGKTAVEWVRVTPKGLDFLLDQESPVRALEDLRELLTLNQAGLPQWLAELNVKVSEQVQKYTEEVRAVSARLAQLSRLVEASIQRAASVQAQAPEDVPWAQDVLEYLARRQQVGLGPRCPLVDLLTSLREKHSELPLREFHVGLKRLRESDRIELLPSPGPEDAPGPEYALLDGASVYYYAASSSGSVNGRD